jgi:hypothetical protein
MPQQMIGPSRHQAANRPIPLPDAPRPARSGQHREIQRKDRSLAFTIQLSGSRRIPQLVAGRPSSQPPKVLFMDDPDHTRWRTAAAHVFTPKAVVRFEEKLRNLAANICSLSQRRRPVCPPARKKRSRNVCKCEDSVARLPDWLAESRL